MKRLIAVALILAGTQAQAQDPLFTQITSAPQYLNPAMSGSDTLARVDLAYRLQWPKLSGNYSSFFGSYSQYISPLNGYAGVHFMYDHSGPVSSQRYSMQYAQNIRLGKNLLVRPAFEATYFSRQLDWNQLTFGDMIDPRRGFIYESGDVPRGGKVSGVDFSSGLLVCWKKTYLGLSAHHLTQPEQSLIAAHSPLPMKFGIQLGFEYDLLINRSFTLPIMPYFNYTAQGNFNTWMAGLNLKFNNHILVGGGFRKDDALLLNAGYQHRCFRIVYSFDYTTSNLGIESGGSHEISMAFFFWKQKANKHYLPVSLPM